MNYKEEVAEYFENLTHTAKKLEHKVKVTEERRLELLDVAKRRGSEYFYFKYVENSDSLTAAMAYLRASAA